MTYNVFSGTLNPTHSLTHTEWICAKFTVKMYLVPRSFEFECQGQRSRSPGTKFFPIENAL